MVTLSYAEPIDDVFADWVSVDDTGLTYDSYVVAGYKVHGQGQRKFQSNYVVLWTANDLTAGGFVQAFWDTATDIAGHRASRKESLIVGHQYQEYGQRRLWIRGQGLVLNIKISSDGNKPFTLVGWSTFETGNSQP